MIKPIKNPCSAMKVREACVCVCVCMCGIGSNKVSIREYFSFSLIIAGLQPEKVEINLRLSVPDSSDACSDLVSDCIYTL